ncbi:LOW QUALITY PROTEIN: reverse transcriptase [Phytophthora megakarya]|uniref:Reverse transcriptase n=1 Tax=Phytophthora megakarya TaxID=4795 RepID=A0A225WT50_9STRA|nr:LOW QUALITY PROTEIN: reverse transcriptase [Phytophthora megakarya]
MSNPCVDPTLYLGWAALLSSWTLKITKCVEDKDEILGALAASITPRSQVDKAQRRKIQAPIPTIERDKDLYAFSFDGSAPVKRGGGAYSVIKLPEWKVLKARSGYAEDLVSRRLVIRGDSNLVIRQVRGKIDCKAPGLTLLRQGALDRLRTWPDHELLHVEAEKEIQDLVTLNLLDEILVKKIEDVIAQISAVTTRFKVRSDSLREKIVREPQIERIRQAQDEESWISGLKKYLVGEIRDLTQEDAKVFGSSAMNYEVDQSDLHFYCPTTKKAATDRDKLMRLVVPETFHKDILHHYHTSLQGSHQEIGLTYDRIRDHFHWRGLYKSVQRYMGGCVNCETGKGRPRIQGESPGNLWATYPCQIIDMGHIPSLPRSFNGNTELLIFVDLFSGYVITKASACRSAQTITETYEECVFHRFDASEVIRLDREPGFMSEFFKSFKKILDQRQPATMAYRAPANGPA